VNKRRTTPKVLRAALTATLLVVALGPAAGATTVPPDDPPPSGDPADDEGDGEGADDGVDAPQPASFAVQPSGPNGPGGRDYFIYTLKTGQLFGDIVSISNLSDERATFVIYATDALNTRDGGFALLREEETPTDVGTWIRLGATQYTVDPGSRVDIPFSLEVPDDATPGDHAGAIVAQQIPEQGAEGDGTRLDVRVRIGARVYVRVDGILSPSLTIEDFSIDYDTPANPFGTNLARVQYTVRNTGNIRLSTVAELEIEGLFGMGRKELPERQIPELLPGSSLQIAETVRDVRPLVRQTTRLEITAIAEDVDVERSIGRWTIPWLAVVIPLVLIGAYVGYRVWRKRQEQNARGDAMT
jgi:hypothetical protein